jgi:uncharacterized protein YpbB
VYLVRGDRMNYVDNYILHILNGFNGERSVSAVYHLLRGKRTSQTIQDGFLFHVHPYFQTLAHITRKELNGIINELENEALIIKKDIDHYALTAKGKRELEAFREVQVIPSGLNGWFYGAMSAAFWKHLNLLIQTISHLHAGISQFMPVTRDETTLNWVKNYLLSQRMPRDEWLNRIYSELDAILSDLPNIEADLLAHRLSGFQCDGLSISQLSESTGKSTIEIVLLLTSGLHRMTKKIHEEDGHNMLKQLLDNDMSVGLTESARKTLAMLKTGYGPEEIAKYRRLKLTTVQDHIVETAFCDPTFSIASFVGNDIYETVVHAISQTNTKKLSSIKQHCPEEIQYFHIRLVLARERIQ